MWSVLKESPLRSAVSIGYAAFLAAYLVVGFMPAHADEPVIGHFALPSGQIYRDVTDSSITHGELYVSDDIVSVYRNGQKKLLMGHSSTAFQRLENARLYDTVFYEGRVYHIVARQQVKVEEVNMAEVLFDTGEDTLVIMTCAGENDSERLILTAR